MNKTAQFTQGPWVAVSTFNGTQLVETQSGCSVCVLADDNDATNAALIAAAPAMYEALRLLLGVDACHNKMIHCGECGYCKGMAALAQAEGK
jgi:hypothetical protein